MTEMPLAAEAVSANMPQVVILAGGLGSRLRSVSARRPKILMPVCGRAFIEWQFDLLRRCKATEVLLCVGYGGDEVEAHVADGARFGMNVRYSREDPGSLLGTGGALVNALPSLARRFLVMYGDSYLPVDYSEFATAFAACRLPVMMSVFRNAGRWDRSNVRVEGNRVCLYDKHAIPGTVDCIDYGLIGMSRETVEEWRDDPMPLDLAAILGDAVRRGLVAAWMASERFFEIGTPSGLSELESHFRTGTS